MTFGGAGLGPYSGKPYGSARSGSDGAFRLYGLEGEVNGAHVPLGQAAVVREGNDITLVTAMKSVHDALEAADAALLKNRVLGVAELVELSRATLSNIRQNVSLALGLKAVFLATTLFGVTSLWMAILADTGATVLVTSNALRLLRVRADLKTFWSFFCQCRKTESGPEPTIDG